MQSRREQCFVARGSSVALLILAVTFITLGILPQSALAQLESATINGTVTDPTGAVIGGAKVTLHNVGTGVDKGQHQQWGRALRSDRHRTWDLYHAGQCNGI
jgi:hypothetical protein